MASSSVNPASPEVSRSSLRRKTCPSWIGSKSTSHNHCAEVLVVSSPGLEFSPEHPVTDERVEQHQREDDNATPEHEHQAGRRRGSLLDRKDEGDHVRPERQRQGAKRRYEDQRYHVEWQVIVVV